MKKKPNPLRKGVTERPSKHGWAYAVLHSLIILTSLADNQRLYCVACPNVISARGIESAVTPAIDKSDLDGVWREGGLQAVAGVHFVI